MSKLPSPCIGVCKFRLKGHCSACTMTKAQKSMFKKLKKDSHRRAFVTLLDAQQTVLGKNRAWARIYQRKLDKRGISLTD